MVEHLEGSMSERVAITRHLDTLRKTPPKSRLLDGFVTLEEFLQSNLRYVNFNALLKTASQSPYLKSVNLISSRRYYILPLGSKDTGGRAYA